MEWLSTVVLDELGLIDDGVWFIEEVGRSHFREVVEGKAVTATGGHSRWGSMTCTLMKVSTLV